MTGTIWVEYERHIEPDAQSDPDIRDRADNELVVTESAMIASVHLSSYPVGRETRRRYRVEAVTVPDRRRIELFAGAGDPGKTASMTALDLYHHITDAIFYGRTWVSVPKFLQEALG